MSKNKENAMERIYVIPLRRRVMKVPKWRRSKKSINVIRNFIEKHMKTENVKISKEVNESIWQRGSKKPPAKIKVIAIKKDDDSVNVGIFSVKQDTKSKTKEKKIKENKSEKEETKPKKKESKGEK